MADMDRTDLHCALCSIFLETIYFNLKSNTSRHSNSLLISVIENVTGKFLPVHFDICVQCYDLLNELDAIELRQIEIRTLLRKYVEHQYEQKLFNTQNEFLQNTNPIEKEIRICDINLLNCSNDVEKSITPELNNASDLDLESNVFIDPGTFPVMKEEITVTSDLNTEKTDIPTPPKTNGKKKKDPNIVKPHKCHCSKVFRTASELKSHMNTHNVYRAFVCEICGQSYKHKTAFNIHMDMHNGINPFTCIYCHKSFTQKGALARHVPIHTGEMPYQCDECGKRFIHHTSFNIHRLSHTGLKSHKCTMCSLTFISGSHLKRHMRRHTGEKKFACGTCGKRFAERYNLAVHEKLHANPCSSIPHRRTYSCQICGVIFERKMKLEEHLVKEHEIVKLEISNKIFLKDPLADNDLCSDMALDR